jgi:hypothetical protein
LTPHNTGTPRRPSAAFVLSLVALFVALGGSAYAGARLATNSVGSTQIRAGAVGSSELRTGAVTATKLAKNAVRCAAGTVDIAGACFEEGLRPAAGLRAAITTCAMTGKRLPDVGELLALAAVGVDLGDPELSGDVVGNSPTVQQRVVFADATTISTEASTTLRSFRCVGARGR